MVLSLPQLKLPFRALSSMFDKVALNPQPLPPKSSLDVVALNPQPLPPRSRFDAVALNPQPLPPKAIYDDLIFGNDFESPFKRVAFDPQPEPPVEVAAGKPSFLENLFESLFARFRAA